MDHFKFSLDGNTITPSQDRKALKWQQMFIDQFNYGRDFEPPVARGYGVAPTPRVAG